MKRINCSVFVSRCFDSAKPIFIAGNFYVDAGCHVSPHIDVLQGNVYFADRTAVESFYVREGDILIEDFVSVQNCLNCESGSISIGDNLTVERSLFAAKGIFAGDNLVAESIRCYGGDIDLGHGATVGYVAGSKNVNIGHEAQMIDVSCNRKTFIGNNASIENVYSKEDVVLGQDAIIGGYLLSTAGNIHIGAGSTVHNVSAHGDIFIGKDVTVTGTLSSKIGTITYED